MEGEEGGGGKGMEGARSKQRRGGEHFVSEERSAVSGRMVPDVHATHNLWMRVTMVLKAACTSAAEQVDTMGWACSWSSSATYCAERRESRTRRGE